jgi:hypothetical protein
MSRLLRLTPVPVSRLACLALGLTCLVVLGLTAARPGLAQPDAISGLYVHEADPRATIKLLLAPSEKDGMPVGRVWGVLSFKDPGSRADSCMFEFQSTIKSDVITCRDAMNPGCRLSLRLLDRAVALEAAPECLAVYCKGRGVIPPGVYVRTAPGSKKSRRR